VQDASSKQQTRQKCKPNHQQTGLPPHSAHPSEEEKKKKKKPLSTNLTLYKPLYKQLNQPKEGRNQKEERVQP